MTSPDVVTMLLPYDINAILILQQIDERAMRFRMLNILTTVYQKKFEYRPFYLHFFSTIIEYIFSYPLIYFDEQVIGNGQLHSV